jgi:branched-subunit amino acid transport protein AzlD
MDATSFWLWWVLTIAVCLWPLLRVWDNPREVLGFPVIAAMMWLYFYVYLPYQAVSNLEDSLQGAPLNLAQFLCFAAFACLLVGWYLRVGRPTRPPRSAARYDLGKLYVCGIIWLLIGNIGMYSFSASGATYKESSAYWYMLYNVGYAGIALCVITLTLARNRVDPPSLILFIALTCLLAAPALTGARRGPLFTAIISAVFAFLLVSKKMPRLSVALGTLVFAGLIMLIFVEARNYTYRGQTWEDAITHMTLQDILAKRAQVASDNEFVNHCVQIQANLDTEQYQYGTAHLSALLNWIPRTFWPDKPPRNGGWFYEARNLSRPGFTNLGSGGAWGAVADAFNNYWYLTLVFWLLVGWGIAVVYVRAQCGGDLSWKMYYLGILMASHWFIAQCLSEAVVPCLWYQGVFWLSFRFCRINTETVSGAGSYVLKPATRERAAGNSAVPVGHLVYTSTNGVAKDGKGPR